MITRVPFEKTSVSLVVVNDASVTGKRYQESYFCQTPLYYAYEDLMRLYNDKIPKVRQRNATKSSVVPIIPEICANVLVLKALIESSDINNSKSITLTIGSKSLKVNYTYNPNDTDSLKIRDEYFNSFGINFDLIAKLYSIYEKRHRIEMRNSYYDGIMTYEILYNVRTTTFKNYYVLGDQKKLLTKAEYDIYNYIYDRGGASLKLIATEFGYKTSRAAKYHMDKLINQSLVEKVGLDKSHTCFYRIKK